MKKTTSTSISIFQNGRLFQQIAKATFALGLMVSAPSYLSAQSVPCGNNKVSNGDFEAGNTGFSSSYTFTADIAGNTEMVPENRIAVVAE